MAGRKTTKATAKKAPAARKTPNTQASQAKVKATTRTKATAKKTQAKTPAKKGLSQIDAAIAVLGKGKEPMNCKAMVEAMAKQGLWQSPGGATPHATLYASIQREITAKGKDTRFKKTGRGTFCLASKR